MISATTTVAAVIGSPVRHSLSPAIHNAAFAAAGLDWVYVAFEVPEGHAVEALAAVRSLRLGGLSVTMPHKEAVAAALDDVDPAAAALRSVNTVVVDSAGRLRGVSTDGAGFVASLTEHGIALAGCHVAVVGAGAAGRAVVDAVARSGAARITVVNRSAPGAHAAAALAGDRGLVGTPLDLRAADVVVNATPVGMGAETASALPFDADLLGPEHVVVDLVYHPLRTPLLAAADERGARTLDGLGMLVHQAALQQQLWTGSTPDTTAMRAAAIAELDRRRL